jgi:hypothetical protein
MCLHPLTEQCVLFIALPCPVYPSYTVVLCIFCRCHYYALLAATYSSIGLVLIALPCPVYPTYTLLFSASCRGRYALLAAMYS